MTLLDPRSDLNVRARRIAEDVASAHADDVDRNARFPFETFDALRSERLLGAYVPEELGGFGASLTEVGETVFALGRQCASSAMILAMHHLQVACLAAHGNNDTLRQYLREVASRQLLLASATTEVGVGGDVRTSICALERDFGQFHLEKHAGVISYGAYADAVLATCRRHPEAAPNDQVLVLCTPPQMTLEQAGDWDTLGFRGTCSPSFFLRADGNEDRILTCPFSLIAERTMLPVSHVLWSFVWLGIANSAMARARNFVQAEARKKPGVQRPGAMRLAEIGNLYRQLDALVHSAAHQYEWQRPGENEEIGFAIAFNSLKVSASTLLVDIVTRSMAVCGMAGYSQRSPFSLGRHLRDAHGAALMVNNDRIMAENAQMLLVYKEQW